MALTAAKQQRRQISDRLKGPSGGSAYANGGQLLQSHEIPLPGPSPQIDQQAEVNDITDAIRAQTRRAAGLPEPMPEPMPDRPAFPIGRGRRPNALAGLGTLRSRSR